MVSGFRWYGEGNWRKDSRILTLCCLAIQVMKGIVSSRCPADRRAQWGARHPPEFSGAVHFADHVQNVQRARHDAVLFLTLKVLGMKFMFKTFNVPPQSGDPCRYGRCGRDADERRTASSQRRCFFL